MTAAVELQGVAACIQITRELVSRVAAGEYVGIERGAIDEAANSLHRLAWILEGIVGQLPD